MPAYLLLLLFVFSVTNAQQNLPTPYDLIRPVFPLKWDSTVFNRYDTTVTRKRNMLPAVKTPEAFAPTALIPDTLNQAYLDAINLDISPIRVNQAGYLEKDAERLFYYVGSESSFEVVDSMGNSFSPPITGSLTSTGASTVSDWTIIAGTNAATNDQTRYKVSTTGPSGTIQKGNIPMNLPVNERLRIKVGKHISATFVISDRVYSMVRSATLKFYGINRSGDSESWFHPASHTKDGGGPIVSLNGAAVTGLTPKEGALSGGWYDCGDHLKESSTQAAAFMALAVAAAANPDADEDLYDFNHANTSIDGIPDLLREAKHGADFALKAYDFANGVIDNMALSVGNFGADHGWWGRPENQDHIPTSVTGRGGPHERDTRLGELGSNISGQYAAGLAILAKDYAIYDPVFAAKALKVAEEMYDFAKSLAQGKSTYGNGQPFVHNTNPAGWSSPAYNGNNEYFDDLALASICLFYATKDPKYLNDAAESRNLNPTISQEFSEGAGFFNGGWFVTGDKGFLKNGKNTSWANSYSYALYAFYKLILKSEARAQEYGISNEKRLEYIEDVVANMIYNLGDMGTTGSASITLPQGDIGWKSSRISYDPIWFTMFTDQDWIYNRYQAGNIFEVLAYADVAKDLKELRLPKMGTPDWKAEEMYQLGLNQLNYMLGLNPWDVSFLLGVGDKNDAHPHHRASNPEGKNVAGANYKYRPPTGALFGGVRPSDVNSWIPSNHSWEDYHLSETCIDGTAIFITGVMLTSQKFNRSKAPEVQVEILHVAMDSALVRVKLNTMGTAALFYGTDENDMRMIAAPDKNDAGVEHLIPMRDLKNGTTYYFFAGGFNAFDENNMTAKYLVDSTQVPYSFTTFNSIESALIENVIVCNVSADTAEIMWYTPNGEYESKIYWDTLLVSPSEMKWNTGEKNADVAGVPTKFHYVKIGGLKEKTTYYFAVESNGELQSVSPTGEPLQFRTPVTQYDFSVRTYQYHWADMSGININVFNNEGRAFDSLTIRLYMRGKDDIYKDIGIRMDICQAYDEAGFNKPCSPETITELTTLLRLVHPEKIEDTYDAATGTWQWYFPIPLGSTVIKSSSRFRIDVLFDKRSPYPPHLDLMNSAPDKSVYCRAGASWYSPSNEAPADTKNANPGDWSWMPHSRANGDYADYPGMPCLSKDEGDTDFEAAPINPFVSVYRKDEFVWGYSPSYTEMSTKRANYELALTLDAPFNLSNGSHIKLDQTGSTVYVTGTAKITEGGFITKILANGTDIKDVYSAAVYNLQTDMWDLNIPVKMGIGSNKVDITVFAGPDPLCAGCQNNGSCAFENRNFFVEFTRGDASASALRLADADGNPISSPAEPGNTSFYIYLNDKDKAKYSGILYALVINNRQGDTLRVKLDPEGKETGNFRSNTLVSAVSKSPADRNDTKEISFFGGDTIQVIYIDPEDDEDQSRQSFYAESTYPLPQSVIALDTDCDDMADYLQINFSTNFTENIRIDSILVKFIDPKNEKENSGNMLHIQSNFIGENIVHIPLTGVSVPPTASPRGNVTIYLSEDNVVTKESVEISDGIAPTLISVTLLENPEPRGDEDTLKIAFSEKVTLASNSTWPLVIHDSAGNLVEQSTITIIGNAQSDDDGKSYLYSIKGNTAGSLIKKGYKASIAPSFMVTDSKTNRLDPVNGCNPSVIIAETPKPVAIKLAEMRDFTGDGELDEIYLLFEKKLREKDMLDSFEIDWGSPSTIKNFSPKDWSHDFVVSDPYMKYEGHLDTIDGKITNVITDSTEVRDSLSKIIITIPSDKSYPLGTSSGDYNGYGKVKPRLGPEGGFFDKSYPLVDKAPPILLSAQKSSTNSLEVLDLRVSESIKEAEDGQEIIQRKRGSEITSFSPTKHSLSQSRISLIYDAEAPDAIRIGDWIRLVPENMLSKIHDVAGNYPGEENPWIQVKGATAEKTSFKVNILNSLSSSGSKENIYNGDLPSKEEHFRLTVLNKDKEHPLAKGKKQLYSTFGEASYDTSTYKHGGPVFNIEITMPSALVEVAGEKSWDFLISFELSLYDNLGQFVNATEYKFILSQIGYEHITIDGVLSLNLEWISQDFQAPVSIDGKKIATGPYIARFNFSSIATYLIDATGEEDSYKKGDRIKTKEEKTSSFGFRRQEKR